LISPEGPRAKASEPAAAIGLDGRLRLVWTGGWDGRIYYSSAWAGDGLSARAWTKPVALNLDGADGDGPDIALGPEGALHVVYPVAVGDGQGIYYLRSTDGGFTWSSPGRIQGTRLGEGTFVGDLRLAVGEDGAVHVAWNWTAYPETYPPKGIYYARLAAGDEAWSEPLLLAEGPYAYPAILTSGQTAVHVVWSGTGEDRYKFHRWSTDGGWLWSEVWRDAELGGFQGTADLVADAGGTLHWLQVATVFAFGDSYLCSRTWLGDHWSELAVLFGESVSGQNQGYASAAVSLGNELHAVVLVPSAAGGQGWQMDVYHTRGKLAVPGLQPQPLPEASPLPVATGSAPLEETIAAPAVVSTTSAAEGRLRPATVETASRALTMGIAPVVLLLLLVALAAVYRRSRRGG
jgi:hypothetical protein